MSSVQSRHRLLKELKSAGVGDENENRAGDQTVLQLGLRGAFKRAPPLLCLPLSPSFFLCEITMTYCVFHAPPKRPGDDLYEWLAVLSGPADTPYSGGRFRIRLSVPSTYPLAAPTVKFETPIFHPNVHFRTGEVCMDILKTDWSPAWTLMSVCRAVVALMSDPAGGADSPLNCDAGNLARSGDLRAFNGVARMYTVDLAMMQ